MHNNCLQVTKLQSSSFVSSLNDVRIVDYCILLMFPLSYEVYKQLLLLCELLLYAYIHIQIYIYAHI